VNLTLWESGTLVAAVAIVIISGFAMRPRPRRPGPAHQDRRSVTTLGDHREARLRTRSVPPEDVAEWCDRLARRMRSGSTLREALMTTTPSGIALHHATDGLRLALERGQPVAGALDSTRTDDPTQRQRDPHTDLAFAIFSIASTEPPDRSGYEPQTSTNERPKPPRRASPHTC